MNELIKITETNGQRAVSARELHAFLESKQEFANWIKNRIEKYDLIENVDFVRLTNLSSENQDCTSVKSFTVVGNGLVNC